ncbi:MAG: hypothetical protein ACOX6X_05380 [Dethiobacteria bacterium]|jgi:hypothetical protein
MYEEKWDKGRDRECGCCLTVEDSIVILLCGDLEFDRIKGCIHTAIEAKKS